MSEVALSPALPSIYADETVVPVPTSVFTGTACLALMDVECASEVWRDILFDGHDHEHGGGGLMLNSAALGTHVEHDGDFPAVLHTSVDGAVHGLVVNLDPYGSDLDSLRHPAVEHGHGHDEDEHTHAHTHDDEHDAHTHDHSHDDEDHSHGHGPIPDGWSEPVEVFLLTDRALLGDPAGLPDADNTGGLLDLRWPDTRGVMHASVFSERGVRRHLAVVWSPDV